MGAVLIVVVVAFLPAFGALYEQTAAKYLPPITVGPDGPIGVDGLEVEGVATTQARTALYAGSILIARDYAPLGAGLGRYASHMEPSGVQLAVREVWAGADQWLARA